MKISTIAAVGAGLALSLLGATGASAFPILHAYPIHHVGPWVPGWGFGYPHYWGPGWGYGYGHGFYGHGYWGHRWFHHW